jgi:hypothetical protein
MSNVRERTPFGVLDVEPGHAVGGRVVTWRACAYVRAYVRVCVHRCPHLRGHS